MELRKRVLFFRWAIRVNMKAAAVAVLTISMVTKEEPRTKGAGSHSDVSPQGEKGRGREGGRREGGDSRQTKPQILCVSV